MKKLLLWSVLISISLASTAQVKIEQDSQDKQLNSITLENKLLQVKITRRGGRIISFFDKAAGRDLALADGSLFDGLCKSRDLLYNNVEPISANFKLEIAESTPEKAVVTASYTNSSGNLAGMKLVKTYCLEKDKAYLQVKDFLKCLDKKSRFQANAHNYLSLKSFTAADTCFYLPSKRGMTVFDHANATQHRLNLVKDLAAPWVAVVDRKMKSGIALLADNPEQLESMFVWGESDKFTLEANFKVAQLAPVAAADEWEASYALIPINGLPSIAYVSNKAVLSATRSGEAVTLRIYFPAAMEAAEIIVSAGDKELMRKKVAPAAGSTTDATFNAPERTCDFSIKLLSDKHEISIPLSISSDKAAIVEPSHKWEQREVTGVNGFYYYYNELWLSDESWTDVSFGLQGDFSKKSDFRVALELPEGVDLADNTNAAIEKSAVTRQGKIYTRYVFASRRMTYFMEITLRLKVNKAFTDASSAYLKAVWRDGEQTPETICLRKIGELPRIGAGLKHLKISVTYCPEEATPWPDFQKYGVNHMIHTPWPTGIFLFAFKGNGYGLEAINGMADRHIEAAVECSAPFDQVDRVLAGENAYYKGAGTLFHPKESYEAVDLPAARAVDINGKSLGTVICPSYRGRYFEKILDNVKSAVEYGFDNINYDEETWGNGALICFCDRCRNKFQAFLKTDYPNLAYMEPTIFEKEPAKYPELDKAWWDFKTTQVADIYKAIRHTLNTYKPKAGVSRKLSVWVDASSGKGRYGAITGRLTDYAKIGEYADMLLPMIYTADAKAAGDSTAKAVEAVAGKTAIGAGLAPNRAYEYFRVASNNLAGLDAARQQTVEVFFAGAKAAVFWAPSVCLRGANDYLKIAEAVKMIMPVEDILVNGRKVAVESSNPDVSVTAYAHNGAIAVFARNYDRDTVKTSLRCPVKQNAVVIDTYGDKQVAELTTDDNSFPVTFTQDRIRVFLIK